MAERKTLSETGARGAFAEGAERFERIARGAKTQQVTESPATGQPHSTMVLSPDEVWAKNFMSHGIGPRPETSALAGMAPIAHLVAMPKFAAPNEQVLAKPAAVVRAAPVVQTPGGPIGVQIGKPQRKRSWLGRLLRGA